MALDEAQLAVVLQASIEHARARVEEFGGFLPFGARALPDGKIEFVETPGEAPDGEAVDALYRNVSTILSEQARINEIVGAALVANAAMQDEVGGEAARVFAVHLETPGFCRSFIVPYRADDSGAIELGKMIPDEADPVVFKN